MINTKVYDTPDEEPECIENDNMVIIIEDEDILPDSEAGTYPIELDGDPEQDAANIT